MIIALALVLGPSLVALAAENELKQAFTLEIISDKSGIIEELLDMKARASLEPSFDGLTLKLVSYFDELLSDVHDVGAAISAIETLKKKVEGFTGIPPEIRAELTRKLNAAKKALEQGQNNETVYQLLEFIREVEAYQDQGLITTKEARSLIGRADWTWVDYYAERIIAKIDKSKSERIFTSSLSATLSKLELTTKLGTETTRSPVPSRNSIDNTFQLKLNLDLDYLKLTTTFDHLRQDFLRRSGKEENELADELEVIAILNFGNLMITRTIKGKRNFFPDAIGDEIEATKVNEAIASVEALKAEIDSLEGVVDKVKKDLKRKLDTVKKNLERGRGDLAVDNLLDFIELVEQMRRDGRLPNKDDANRLIAKAKAILPDKRSSAISSETEVEFDLNNLDLILVVEAEHENFPTATAKNERATNLKAEAIGSIKDLVLDGIIEKERSTFPKDPKSNKLADRFRIKAELDLNDLTLTGAFESKETIYPNDIKENYVFNKLEFQAKRYLDDTMLTINLEHKKTDYPNDPVDNEVVSKLEFEVEIAILEDLDFNLTTSFKDERFPNDPDSDKMTATIEASLAIGF